MSETENEYPLGEYRERVYVLRSRAVPGWNDPIDWAAVVYYEDFEGEEVQVVRIDTSNGYTHVDQLYRRENEKPAFDGDLWDAMDLLKENWRTYAESYEKK